MKFFLTKSYFLFYLEIRNACSSEKQKNELYNNIFLSPTDKWNGKEGKYIYIFKFCQKAKKLQIAIIFISFVIEAKN